MLMICHGLRELNFSALMEVYIEGNRENGEENYPDLSPARQQLCAEQDFYNYLQQVFFHTEGACYAVWVDGRRYCAALRLEPYRDGLLLCALETAPQLRRKGYASTLIKHTIEYLRGETCGKVYSHVNKRNEASLRTHSACGFKIIKDHAVYLNGSANYKSYTLCLEL